MDHSDHIKSPSVERRKVLEKRMEMIGLLINQMQEGGSGEESSEEEKKRKRNNDCNGILTFKWFGNLFQRMFP